MWIYGLSEPETGELRYVGQTRVPLQKRLRQHCYKSVLARPCHRSHWIQGLLDQGLRPAIAGIQEIHCEADMDAAETYWIQFLRDRGCRLVNETSGGEGLRNPSPETRARMSAAKKGQPSSQLGLHRSEATKELLRQVNLGKRASPEARAKMSASHQGFRHTPEAIEKMSRAKLGKKKSPETREKMRLAKLGTRASPETRAKLSAMRMGHPVSAETREKMRQARLRRQRLNLQQDER